jgi:hypothetical protein
MSTSRPDRRLRTATFVLTMAAAFAFGGCAVPYPVVTAGGPFEVPPSPSRDPLDDRGARVTVVATAPAGCRFLGLATGVGGAKSGSLEAGEPHFGEYREQALVALRNAVGAVGGTHVVPDAEVTFFHPVNTNPSTLTAVLVRGPALSCPR